MNKNKQVSSKTLNFLKENILSVTELTRSNKLSEILNKYAGEKTEEVYVIQSSKNRNAAGVLVDLEHYEDLIRLQELFEQTLDDYMYQTALKRQNDIPDIPLSEVVEKGDFDLNSLVKDLADFELDED
ncbi:MAG: hypothetical protein ABFD18_12945 [Syntrophomonas sp.]